MEEKTKIKDFLKEIISLPVFPVMNLLSVTQSRRHGNR